jgi:hypothetical protein
LEGDLVVSYDDPSGERVEERYPFSLNILEISEVLPDSETIPVPQPATPWWRKPVTWGVSAAALTLFFLLRKRGPLRKLIRARRSGNGEDDADEID